MCKICKSEVERFCHACLVDAKEVVRWHVLEYGRQPSIRWMRKQVSHAALRAVQDEINRSPSVGKSLLLVCCCASPRVFDHLRGRRYGQLLRFPKVMPNLEKSREAIKGATWQSLLGGLVILVAEANMADLQESGLLDTVKR